MHCAAWLEVEGGVCIVSHHHVSAPTDFRILTRYKHKIMVIERHPTIQPDPFYTQTVPLRLGKSSSRRHSLHSLFLTLFEVLNLGCSSMFCQTCLTDCES